MIDEPLEIAGNKNIHRRRRSQYELPVPVVFTGPEEVIKDLVGIGSTDKFVDRKTHLFCIISGENISEISCRNNEIYLISGFYPVLIYKL